MRSLRLSSTYPAYASRAPTRAADADTARQSPCSLMLNCTSHTKAGLIRQINKQDSSGVPYSSLQVAAQLAQRDRHIPARGKPSILHCILACAVVDALQNSRQHDILFTTGVLNQGLFANQQARCVPARTCPETRTCRL